MTRRDDPALYRAAERLLAAIQMAGDDGSSHSRWQRRALRLIREAYRAARLEALIALFDDAIVEYAYERWRDGKLADTTEGGFGTWTQELAIIAAQRRERVDIAIAKHRKRRNPYTYRVVKRTIGPWVPA